jgi:short subunit dehydrogenase-like uncharacterized protein
MALRDHDIVLFGATGFTGSLTARHLGAHAPAGLRWALAGRDPGRLEQVRAGLPTPVPVLIADSADRASLDAIARSARVVATTVGPYTLHGAQLVAACAEAGTDYVDLTGEPEFIDRTYLDHHERAVGTGARLVHACGFDSIPYDLGVQHAMEVLQPDGTVRVDGYVRFGGSVSGGTLASMMTAFSRLGHSARTARERRRAQPHPSDRRIRIATDRPGRAEGGWVLPFPSVDPQVVARSAAALPEYGPDFTYSHHVQTKGLLPAIGLAAGAMSLVAAAQTGPTRRAVLRRIPAGEGPSAQKRAASWFSVRFVATCGTRRVVTQVSGGDPGYGETAKMLGESALCLAGDPVPAVGGQLTTAVAMGALLRQRLVARGIQFDVIEG